MINNKIIIKLRETTCNDVSIVMFNHERLNKEFLITDYKILLIDHVYVPFRKTLT